MSQQATVNWLVTLAETDWLSLANLPHELLPSNLIEPLDSSLVDKMPDLQLAQDLFKHLLDEEHNLTMLLVTLADVVFGTSEARLKALLTANSAQNWITEAEEQQANVSALDVVCDQLTTCLIRNRYPFKVPESDAANIDMHTHGKSKVLVMTLHKSKGQEFDTVIMPALSESDFPSAATCVKPGRP